MTRKAAAILVAALAISVAALGLFLCTRCDHGGEEMERPAPRVDTLMIDSARPH